MVLRFAGAALVAGALLTLPVGFASAAEVSFADSGPVDLSVGSKLVAGDLDGDGDVDFASLASNGIVVLENTDGTAAGFVRRVLPADNSKTVELADVNRDGLLDVVGSNGWFENGGDFSFTARPVFPIGAAYVVPIDTGLDGTLDFAIVQGTSSGQSVMLATSTGDPTQPFLLSEGVPLGATRSLVAAPFIDADRIVCGLSGSGVLLGKVSKDPVGLQLSQVAPQLPWEAQPLVGDFNGDGFEDVLIAGWGSTRIAYNNGDNGTFTSTQVFPVNTMIGVAAADFDGDGTLDVAVSEGGPTISWLSQGDGWQLRLLVPRANGVDNYTALCAADVDGDGRPDIVAANGDHVRVLTNGGTFPPLSPTPTPTPVPTPGVEPICPDLNGDGNVDAADLLGVLMSTF